MTEEMKILKIYKKYMIRAILYKTVTKCMIALVLALAWNYTANKSGFLSMVDHAFFILGAVLMLLSWFNYLSLDGLRINFSGYQHKRDKKKKKKHRTSDIVDYSEEEVVPFDELERDEQVACKLASNLIAGAVFLIPSLVAMVL